MSTINNKILQIKRSTTSDLPPQNLLFGEFAYVNAGLLNDLYIGNSENLPVLVGGSKFNSSEGYIYENNLKKFVSIGGNDLNNGQSNKPYLTINKALQETVNGAVIKIDAGIYTEDIILNSNNHSQKAIVGDFVSSNGIVNKTYLSGLIEILEPVKQFTLSNIILSNAGFNTLIRVASTEGNINFNSISVSGSVQSQNIIGVFSGGTGYISLNGCDFQHKSIHLANTGTLRYCFITNCRNLVVEAGTNWIVIVDRVSVIEELTDNNNIIRDDVVNDVVNIEPTLSGIYIAGASITIIDSITGQPKIINKGDVFTKENTTYRVIEKHYNAKNTYYVINKQTTYVKTQGEYRELTSYPINLQQ